MQLQDLENHLWLVGFYAAIIYAAALLSAKAWLRWPKVATAVTGAGAGGRYGSLDGLRGVLAVGVFVHHSFTAFLYFSDGKWQWSQSPLLNHLGQTTVAVFFAITAFLFTRKALSPTISWTQFFIDRIARLWPAYLLVVAIVFTSALTLTAPGLREPPAMVTRELLEWMSLGLFGAPNINGLQDTWTLISGVNWSLRYELLFYVFAFPTLYIAARLLPNRILLFSATLILAAVLVHQHRAIEKAGNGLHAAHFLSGIVAAYLYSEPRILSLLRSKTFHWIAGSSSLSLLFMLNAYQPPAILVTLLLFCAFTGGLSVFGLLNTRSALWLGDISYGIYLMHGLFLWFTLFLLRTAGLLIGLTLLQYTAIIVCLSLLVVTAATLSYVYLELPVMAKFKKRRLPSLSLSPLAARDR